MNQEELYLREKRMKQANNTKANNSNPNFLFPKVGEYDENLTYRKRDMPVAPLPNPGEGGPVGGRPEIDRPVAPLPNPGEGGSAGIWPEIDRPVAPLPNPGEGGSVGVWPGIDIPVAPLPNPGEGGPIFPGITLPNIIPGIIGTIISTHPKPNVNCSFCNASFGDNGAVRFLNTASNYPPFLVYVNEDLFAKDLKFAEITEYEKVSSGYQTISIVDTNGYIYIQKPIMVERNKKLTISIVNTETGLDLVPVYDDTSNKPYYGSAVRACNLSYNSGALNVVIGERYVTFNHVTFKEVTDYKNIRKGDYYYYVSKSGYQSRLSEPQNKILVSSILNVNSNTNYTIYMFNWDAASPNSVRVLVVADQ